MALEAFNTPFIYILQPTEESNVTATLYQVFAKRVVGLTTELNSGGWPAQGLANEFKYKKCSPLLLEIILFNWLALFVFNQICFVYVTLDNILAFDLIFTC